MTPQTEHQLSTQETVAIGAEQLQRLYLVGFVDGQAVGVDLPNAGSITIGRSSSADVRVHHPSVSRLHARLHMGDPVRVEDLDSSNGTQVEDRPVGADGAALRPGETLRLGSASLVLQFRPASMPARVWWSHDYFEERVTEECVSAQALGTPLALVRIHCANRLRSDEVQQVIAAVVATEDIAGVYGPGEFELLLLPERVDQAERLIAAVDAALAQRGIAARAGVARFPQDARGPYELAAVASAATRGDVTTPIPERHGSPLIARVYERARDIATHSDGVLISGEPGVGKRMVAELIHRLSARAGQPLVTIKGTAAEAPSLALDCPAGATIFVDEIGALSAAHQEELVRLAAERDVRIIAATSCELGVEASAERFRRDLFGLVSAHSITLPALRDRAGEIHALAARYARQACDHMGRTTPPVFSDAAIELMQGYTWPGNLRELRNVIERAVLLCHAGPIGVDHLPADRMRATSVRDTLRDGVPDEVDTHDIVYRFGD